ncbi:lung seven transmembrane receptor-domain-containing protein [Radiomyces spectabilis]|uniref:lung seven transmembrane receptor-domain-containing protein n=1 Tax=Radiomyces spectabilis TaxID=64574 RepID=UPI00221F8AC7|nr:lung seven transmembrane receptor-domain-containing protein [Radiomyces spectabilis]KAI8367551.1 lung seven transmembrane receptor-domain-containing protein [Radiomyces spectabilis]
MRGLFWVLFTYLISLAWASPELVLKGDDRKAIEVASFGFLAGGQLTLKLDDFRLSHPTAPGIVAFYIRKGNVVKDRFASANVMPADESTETPAFHNCFLDNKFIKDELDDGAAIVEELASPWTMPWQTQVTVDSSEEGLWEVLFINCKEGSTASLRLSTELINPNNNHLSAGDSPLPTVYAVACVAYILVAGYWFSLLTFRQDTKVFRAHWLMLLLIIFIFINKALQSAKYHYMKIGVLSEGWRIGFYLFASVKGILSILILVLLASGWMFIKPFLSSKDKKVISAIVPLQVLANVASAIGSEAAVGSADWSFWNMLLPLIDLTACGVVLWTILQTRKHLGAATSADKEMDILNKYKLWSTFYIVTLVYIYITRILVTLLQASLPFQYVTWLGEAVNEVATLLFYAFIGYKFRPYPDNPYTQVPDRDDLEEDNSEPENSAGDSLRLQAMSRRDKNTVNESDE